MKVGIIVLANKKNSLASVDYVTVTDALLAGGVFPDELVLLPYDAPDAIGAALSRMSAYGAVFFIAEKAVLGAARRALAFYADPFPEEGILETEKTVFALLPAGMDGLDAVKRLISVIDKRRGTSYFRIVLRTVGAPEERIRDCMDRAYAAAPGILYHVAEKYGETRIELIYDKNTPKVEADEATRIFASDLADYVYAVEDVGLAERLVEALRVRRLTVSVAESFTGGGVGRAIVRVPGASAVYYEGLNTYNERSKRERLGVTDFTIERRGTVSEETAYEMAAGLITGGRCDLAVATTGVAGPDPDEKGNPAGLCYLAVGTREAVKVYRYKLSGDRETVTETAIRLALFLAYKELK